MNHPYRTLETVRYFGKPWRVVDPDRLQPIGYYRWRWVAYLVARWYVWIHPMSECLIQTRKSDR
jgi:hypothetical protein